MVVKGGQRQFNIVELVSWAKDRSQLCTYRRASSQTSEYQVTYAKQGHNEGRISGIIYSYVGVDVMRAGVALHLVRNYFAISMGTHDTGSHADMRVKNP